MSAWAHAVSITKLRVVWSCFCCVNLLVQEKKFKRSRICWTNKYKSYRRSCSLLGSKKWSLKCETVFLASQALVDTEPGAATMKILSPAVCFYSQVPTILPIRLLTTYYHDTHTHNTRTTHAHNTQYTAHIIWSFSMSCVWLFVFVLKQLGEVAFSQGLRTELRKVSTFEADVCWYLFVFFCSWSEFAFACLWRFLRIFSLPYYVEKKWWTHPRNKVILQYDWMQHDTDDTAWYSMIQHDHSLIQLNTAWYSLIQLTSSQANSSPALLCSCVWTCCLYQRCVSNLLLCMCVYVCLVSTLDQCMCGVCLFTCVYVYVYYYIYSVLLVMMLTGLHLHRAAVTGMYLVLLWEG